MDKIFLPKDFKEFLKLLNDHSVQYLVVGRYAVGYHGYPRATVELSSFKIKGGSIDMYTDTDNDS